MFYPMLRMLFHLLLMIVLAATVRGESARPTTAPSSRPVSPIRYRHVVRADPPMHLHIATVDLTDPRVRIRVRPGGDDPDGPVGQWQATMQTVREVATRDGLDLAVNASYFMAKDFRVLAGRRIPYFIGNPTMTVGWAISDGVRWGGTPADAGGAQLVVDETGRVSIGSYRAGNLPRNVQQLVAGPELLLTDGRITATAKDLAPRTVAGIDRDGKVLTLLVVDGRRPEYSAGMNGQQLGQTLLELGCWRAIMLDGGGSSTMVLRDPLDAELQLMNRPSDGHDLPIAMSFERAVASVLGVTIDR